MSNIRDYVYWRGDLSFEEREFNVIDNLVFCELTYANIASVFKDHTSITLHDLVDILAKENKLDPLLIDGTVDREGFIDFEKAVANSKRFGNVVVERFEENFDKEKSIQFAAMTFKLNDTTSFIAYRGTDDTLTGWKEDFMIAFQKVLAQDAAINYANSIIDDSHNYYIGGHSKGANLALYAACELGKEKQDRVLHVYVNDGPGLCSDVLDTSTIAAIDHKTTKVVPVFDVVGKIFEMPITDNHIVQSSVKMMLQHELLTWQLKNNELDEVSENTPESKWIGKFIDEWIGDISTEDREIFITDLFDALAASGVVSLNDLNELTPRDFQKVLHKMKHANSRTWQIASTIPLSATIGKNQTTKTTGIISKVVTTLKESWAIRSSILVTIGVLFMLLPQTMIPFTVGGVLGIFVLGIIANTFKKLKESNWKIGTVQIELFICLFSIILFVIVLVKESALMLISNVVYGVLFMFIAYNVVEKTRKEHPTKPQLFISGVETIILCFMAIFILISPIKGIYYFTFICGIILFLESIIQIIHGIRTE